MEKIVVTVVGKPQSILAPGAKEPEQPPQYLPEAERVAQRVNETLLGVKDRLTKASEPEPDWNLFSNPEIEKRQAVKKDQARSKVVSDLDYLEKDITREQKNLRDKYETALRPKGSSPVTLDKQQADLWDARASRRIGLMNIDQLKAEHKRALDNGWTDYASELVELAELKFTGAMDAPYINQLRGKHNQALGLQLYPASLGLLKKTLEHLAFRRTSIASGGDISEYKTMDDLERISRLYSKTKGPR